MISFVWFRFPAVSALTSSCWCSSEAADSRRAGARPGLDCLGSGDMTRLKDYMNGLSSLLELDPNRYVLLSADRRSTCLDFCPLLSLSFPRERSTNGQWCRAKKRPVFPGDERETRGLSHNEITCLVSFGNSLKSQSIRLTKGEQARHMVRHKVSHLFSQGRDTL